jgi:multidrug resistance efflux pump
MMTHPLISAAVLLLASGAIAAGLGATSGQDEPKPPEKAAPPAGPRDRSADERRFEAIERRLRDLELKLEEVATNGRLPSAMLPVARDSSVKIRPRFEGALVEKVFAATGQAVKKGEPLVALRCIELARAKTDLRLGFVQWDHDRKYLKAREALHKDGRITETVWADTITEEKKSRLNYLVAREKLATFGMTDEQIDQLLEGIKDAKDAKIRRLSSMTIVSPIDGVVIERDVTEGNFYDQTNVLFVIAPRKP